MPISNGLGFREDDALVDSLACKQHNTLDTIYLLQAQKEKLYVLFVCS
jgi:hypothetical protein